MTEKRKHNRLPLPASLRFYTGFATALTPIIHLSKPLLSGYGGFRDTVPERLGKFSPALDELIAIRENRGLLWIHAVSVGEAAVAGALVTEIRQRRPQSLIAISTTTFTGRDFILKNFTPDALFFFPLDLPSVMRGLVDKLRPDCFLDIEVELWPNLFRALIDSNIPMALANGRISDRAANPPWALRGLYRWLLGSMDALFMRSREDVDRAIALGSPPDKTFLAGNLKFAACGNPLDAAERERIRSILGIGEKSKLFVAGSTHPGEDELIIEAWQILNRGADTDHAGHPGPVHLILAPRHLEQVDRIAGLIQQSGEKVALWTDVRENNIIPDGVRVVVVNTIGELIKLYGAADVAFVGGSLVKRGGHNVLEPVAMGIPTLHGPSMENFHDLKKVLGDASLIVEVADPAELADSIRSIFHDVDLADYRSRARALIDRQLKAADMIADWVAGNLPG